MVLLQVSEEAKSSVKQTSLSRWADMHHLLHGGATTEVVAGSWGAQYNIFQNSLFD